MANGRLSALGTPLRLKNAYGSGYRLNLVLTSATDDAVSAIVDGVTARAPSAHMSLRDASSLELVVPFSCLEAMPAVLDWIDSVTVPSSGSAGMGEAQLSDAGVSAIAAKVSTSGATTTTPARSGARAAALLPGHGPASARSTASQIQDQANPQPSYLVREYGVSGPTLESVFITVSAGAHFELAESTARDLGQGAADDFISTQRQQQVAEQKAAQPAERSLIRRRGGGVAGSAGASGSSGGSAGLSPLDVHLTSSSPAGGTTPLLAPASATGISVKSAVGSSGGAKGRPCSNAATDRPASASAAAAAAACGAGKPHGGRWWLPSTWLRATTPFQRLPRKSSDAADSEIHASDSTSSSSSAGAAADSNSSSSKKLQRPLFMHQYRALARKNAILLTRQRGLFFCQVLTPLLVLGLLLMLRHIVRTEIGNAKTTTFPPLLLLLNLNQLMGEAYSMENGIYINGTLYPYVTDPYDVAVPGDGSSSGVDVGGRVFLPDPYDRRQAEGRSSGLAFSLAAGSASYRRLTAADLARFFHQRSYALPVTQSVHRSARSNQEKSDGSDGHATRSYSRTGPYPPAPGNRSRFQGDPCASNTTNCTWIDTDCLEFFLFAAAPDGSVGAGDNLTALEQRIGALPQQYRPPDYNSSGTYHPIIHPYPHNGSGLLGGIKTAWCHLRNDSVVLAPFFDHRPGSDPPASSQQPQPPPIPPMPGSSDTDVIPGVDLPSAAMDDELMATLYVLNDVPAGWLDNQPPCGRYLRNESTGLVNGWFADALQADVAGRLLLQDDASSGVQQGVSRPGPQPQHRRLASSAASGNHGTAIKLHSTPIPAPSPSVLPYDPSLEQWLCPAYLLPDGTVTFHAVSDIASAVQRLRSMRQSASTTSTSRTAFGGLTSADTHVAASGATAGREFQPDKALRLVLSYTLQVNDHSIEEYHRPNNFSRLGFWDIPTSHFDLAIEPARLAMMDKLWRGYVTWGGLDSNGSAPVNDVRHASSSSDVSSGTSGIDDAGSGNNLHVDPSATQGATEPIPWPLFDIPALSAVGTMPFAVTVDFLTLVEVIGAVLHPITLTLQLPLFVFITVLEKEERLIELQRAMGLRYGAYWSVTYALNFLVYCAVAGSFWAAAYALNFKFFVQTSPALMVTVLIGWGLALCSMAMLLSSFLWSRKSATVLGYVVALFGNLFAIVIAAGVYGNSDIVPGADATFHEMPPWFYVVPIFALVRFLFLGTFQCIARQACYDSFMQMASAPGEVRTIVWSLYLAAVAYLLLALYLDQVLPRKYGVTKHPLWFLLPSASGEDTADADGEDSSDGSVASSADAHSSSSSSGSGGRRRKRGSKRRLSLRSIAHRTWSVLSFPFRRLHTSLRFGIQRLKQAVAAFIVPPPDAGAVSALTAIASMGHLPALAGSSPATGAVVAGLSAGDLGQPFLDAHGEGSPAHQYAAVGHPHRRLHASASPENCPHSDEESLPYLLNSPRLTPASKSAVSVVGGPGGVFSFASPHVGGSSSALLAHASASPARPSHAHAAALGTTPLPTGRSAVSLAPAVALAHGSALDLLSPLFAYVRRWVTVAASSDGVLGLTSLTLQKALRNYAAGEDADVTAERTHVQSGVWPHVLSHLLSQQQRTAGVGKSGGTATAAASAGEQLMATTKAADVAPGPPPEETIFDRYPVIVRHLRKEFKAGPPPKPKSTVSRASCCTHAGRRLGLLSAPPEVAINADDEDAPRPAPADASGTHAKTASTASITIPRRPGAAPLRPLQLPSHTGPPHPHMHHNSSGSTSHGPQYAALASDESQGGEEGRGNSRAAKAKPHKENTSITGSSGGTNAEPSPSGEQLQSPWADIDGGHGARFHDLEATVLTSAGGTKLAVSDLTLAIERGTVLGLLGENGAQAETLFEGYVCSLLLLLRSQWNQSGFSVVVARG